MNLQAIVRIKTCCRVSENFVRNFVFLCICCNFRLRILGFLVSAGHAFVKIRPLLLSTFYKTRNETRWLMGNIIYIYISLQRARQNFPVKCLWKKKTKHIYHKWPRKHPGRLFNFRRPSEGVQKREAYHYCNNLKKTNILSAKLSGEFKDSGISSSSIDTSRPSRDPYRSLKSQH